jgi:NAD(P)-dependent dehydrogenase (short-subunit alcohol dehydrogenase family)
MRFDGSAVVVTGVSSGIGLATARRFLADGATVVGCDTAPAGELVGADRFTYIPADVTNERAVAEVFAAVPGRLSGVVHSAGVPGGGPVHLLDAAEGDDAHDVRGRRSRHVIRSFADRSGGRAGTAIAWATAASASAALATRTACATARWSALRSCGQCV